VRPKDNKPRSIWRSWRYFQLVGCGVFVTLCCKFVDFDTIIKDSDAQEWWLLIMLISLYIWMFFVLPLIWTLSAPTSSAAGEDRDGLNTESGKQTD